MPKRLEMSEAQEIYELMVGQRSREVIKKYGVDGTLGPAGFYSINQIEAEVFRILGKSWKRKINLEGVEEEYYATMDELPKKGRTPMDDYLDTPESERKKSAKKRPYNL